MPTRRHPYAQHRQRSGQTSSHAYPQSVRSHDKLKKVGGAMKQKMGGNYDFDFELELELDTEQTEQEHHDDTQ